MRAHHAFAVILHERHEVLLLLIRPVALAGDEQKHRVEIVEISRVPRGCGNGLLRNPLRISPDVRVVESGIVTQSIDHAKRVADGIVRVSGVRVANREEFLALRGGRLRAAGGHQDDEPGTQDRERHRNVAPTHGQPPRAGHCAGMT